MSPAPAPVRPWLTLVVAGAALLSAVVPGAAGALEYERAAVEAGEIWRLVTGQLVHWTPRMLLADLAVLLVLGIWLETRSRRLAAVTMAAGALLVGLGLPLWTVDLARYRGASGIASGLFVAAAIDIARRAPRGWARAAAGGLLGLFALKLLWEQSTGTALAAGALPAAVTVVPQVHLLGGLAGLNAVVMTVPRPRRPALPAQSRGLRMPGYRGLKTTLTLLAAAALVTTGGCGSDRSRQSGGGAALPPVDDIIQRYIDARGGADALARIDSIRWTGQYELNGESHPLTVYQKRPSHFRAEIMMDGERVSSVTDGQAAWQIKEEEPDLPDFLPEDQAARYIEEIADFDGPLVDYRAKGHSVELAGRADVDGTDTYHLKLTLKSGRVQDWFLDSDTFRTVKKITPALDEQGGEYPRIWRYLDYREADGVVLPHHTEREDHEMVRTITMEEIEFNPGLDDALFRNPLGG